jgi:hypothetical protein
LGREWENKKMNKRKKIIECASEILGAMVDWRPGFFELCFMGYGHLGSFSSTSVVQKKD